MHVFSGTDSNEGLNDTALPSFASYAGSPAAVIRHENLSCPVISGQYADGRSVGLSLDPSYLDYAHCVCVEGIEVGAGSSSGSRHGHFTVLRWRGAFAQSTRFIHEYSDWGKATDFTAVAN